MEKKPFKGEIDNVHLWDKPLTDSEILALYDKSYLGKPRGWQKINPLAWWRYRKRKKHLVFYWPLQ